MKSLLLFCFLIYCHVNVKQACAQELIRDLGLGQTQENIISSALSRDKFIIGTSPYGHLYSFDPSTHEFVDKAIVLEKYRKAYIWTMCSDDSGIVYGGTSGGRESSAIFVYNPDGDLWVKKLKDVGLINETFIFSSANTKDYVYFGTYPGGKLISYNKATQDVAEVLIPFAKEFVQEKFQTVYDLIVSKKSDYEGEAYIRCLSVGPGERILGGTEHGFLFAYDPFTKQYEYLNVNQQIGASSLGTLYFLESNGTHIFGGISGSNEIGTFKVELNTEIPVKKVFHQPGGTLLKAGYMKLVNDVLYVASEGGFAYNLTTGNTTKINFGGRYVKYTNDSLCVLYTTNLKHKFAYYDITEGTRKIQVIPEPDLKKFPSGGSAIHSITTDERYVYGGVYLTGNFLRHDLREDTVDNSIEDLGYCGGDNADVLIEHEGLIYSGLYPILSVGIFDPQKHYAELIPRAGGRGEFPSPKLNPVLRSLREDDQGSVIDDQKLVRITCFALDKANNRLYIGTGPSTLQAAEGDANIIRMELPVGEIRHLNDIFSNLKKITDMAFYNNLLFVLGEGDDKVLIIDVSMPDQPRILFAEPFFARDILIDSKTRKVYLSVNGNSLRIYQLPELLKKGFTQSPYLNIKFKKHITDIVKGNDSNIYVSYRSWLGMVDSDDEFTEISKITSENPYTDTINCLAVSKNKRNKRIYMGASNGHMYVLFRENFNP